MSREEAKEVLISSIEGDARHDAALLVREIEQKAKEEGETRPQYHWAGRSALCSGSCSGKHRIRGASAQR